MSATSDFSTILLSKNSYQIRNWTYEKEKDTFVLFTYNGVPSSYVGRRVRYESRYDELASIDDYLTRGETYYFRVTQYDIQSGTEYTPTIYTDIIYT